MPTDSKYTDKIITFMKREKRPVTASEITEAVGISRQGAYWWINSQGRQFLRAVGEGRNSATAYVLADEADKYPANFVPHGVWTVTGRRGKGQDQRPNLRLGSVLKVTGLRMDDGDTLVDLTDDEKVTFTINVGPG